MKPRAYGPFPYSPIIDRPRLEWPNGAHVALWIIPNIEYFSMLEKPGGYGASAKIPDVVMWSERDYGNRVGVFRIMDTLDRYGIRGTVALNSNLCAEHPRIMEEGEKRKWEWMGHNESNTRRLNEAGPGEEAQIVRNTFATIKQHTGKPVKGWLSSGLQETWDTLDHLIDNGCEYVADWCNDDQPYQMTLDDGRTIVVDALYPAAQRQVGDRATLRFGRGLRQDDLRSVRCALQGGREVGPRHGDRAASLSDRRAAPDRGLRCGIKVHLQTQEGLEGYRLGNCKPLPGAIGWRHDEFAAQETRGWRTAMKLFRTVLAALLLAPGLLAPSAARAADDVTIGTVGSASANIWPVFIGIKKGFFEAENLKVDIVYVQSSANLVQQLAAGSLDITMSTGLVDPIRAIAQKAPLAIARLEVQAPPYALLAKSSIKELKDLKGKVISLGGPKDITKIYVERMLAPHGVKPGEFDMVFAGATSARASALQAGAVDAAILLPPFNFHATAAGFNELGLTVDYAPELPFSGTVINRNWAAKNGPVVQRILSAHSKSVAWFYDPKNRAEAVAMMAEASKIKTEDVEKSYDFFIKGKYFEPTGITSRKKLNALVAAMQQLGDLPTPFDTEQLALQGVTKLGD